MDLTDKDKAIVALIVMITITLLVSYSASFQILRLKTAKSNYIIITKNIDDSKELRDLLEEKDNAIYNLENDLEVLNGEKESLRSELERVSEEKKNLILEIEEKKRKIREMEENSKESDRKMNLSLSSGKRLSYILRRYSYLLEKGIEEYQKDPRKFIRGSVELENMVGNRDEDDFLRDLYTYIIDNFYYFYDPFVLTSDGIQEWNFFLAYDLKSEEWIMLPLNREEFILHILPETIFYPEETIDLSGGDCEDLAILYVSACIHEGYDAYVYVVDIGSADPLIHPSSHTVIVVDNTLVDLTMKQFIAEDDLFEQYGNAIHAEKIILRKIYNDEIIEEKNVILYST
jgi:hypothetical protein